MTLICDKCHRSIPGHEPYFKGRWMQDANNKCIKDFSGAYDENYCIACAPTCSTSPNRDACPMCLDQLKVRIGEKKRLLKTSGNYVWYQFECPDCSHEWQCMFYED